MTVTTSNPRPPALLDVETFGMMVGGAAAFTFVVINPAAIVFALPFVLPLGLPFALLIDLPLLLMGRGRPDRARTGVLAWANYMAALAMFEPMLLLSGLSVRAAGALGGRARWLILVAVGLQTIRLIIYPSIVLGAASDVGSAMILTGFILLAAAAMAHWWGMRPGRLPASPAPGGFSPEPTPQGAVPPVLALGPLSAEEQAELAAVRRMFRS